MNNSMETTAKTPVFISLEKRKTLDLGSIQI